ncbi:MAG: DHH family phosphoesterase, partial [Solirubrobacteraceae bacterium]|nr:DHH family phosphoesterase [Solirubrobacteraceae bacterium]
MATVTDTQPARPESGASQEPTAESIPGTAPGTPAAEVAAGEPHAVVVPSARPVVSAVDPLVVGELRRVLGVTHVTAQALARRGFVDPTDARAWLAGRTDEVVPLPGLDDAAELVLRHVRAGNDLLVHGDYDVDGVSATAILLDVLELLGASPKWHLPKRGTDGYGLTSASLERIGRLGPKLVITVDCGITAVEQTALLRDAGIDVLITDHHLPRSDGVLPDTAILHPGVLDGELIARTGEPCGAGVAASLAVALLEATGHAAAPLRDGISELAALATIADCVPLQGANRSTVRAGLGALARTRRPGLR